MELHNKVNYNVASYKAQSQFTFASNDSIHLWKIANECQAHFVKHFRIYLVQADKIKKKKLI